MAAIAILALGLGGARARAAGFVQVVSPGGATKTVDLSELRSDVNRTYSNVAPPLGVPGTVTVSGGYSLPMILQSAKLDTSFQSVEIPAPLGPSVVLSAAQATSPGAYTAGGGPAAVWADGAGTHFLAPSAPGGATGAGETFATANLTVKLHGGPPLAVGIFAGGAIVGKPVQFHSTVGGAPPETQLLYQWSFGDGTTGSTAGATHTYTATGTYNVYLQVTGSNDSVGASSVIHVVVGNPPPRPTPSSGTGTGTGSGTGSGVPGGTGTQGNGVGSGTGATTTPAGRTGTVKTPVPAKRSRRPVKRPPRPTGPLVSGIAISYVAQPAVTAGGTAGGAAGAARAAHLRANAKGLRYGMWIWFGVLLALFAGGLLELRGPWRRSWRAPPPTLVKQ
ncbi:MAG TPA: PKD domain-containing protein [Solirubrobacteraceae bacterium]|nr:PKD domain-containing protein [Solirubrobacteraceae bacterium]